MGSQKIDKTKYVAAFSITTLVFIAGILLGSHFSSQKLSTLDEMEQGIRMDTMGTELQYLLFSEDPCSTVNYTRISDELFRMGTRLEFMESKLGKKDEAVLNLKEYYHLLEMRHWMLLKKAKKECGFDYDLIMYFYSNRKDCGKCHEQGYALSYLHDKHNNINVYSFDFHIENPALESLKFLYNVTMVPTLIINGEKYEGFRKAGEIESLLKRGNTTENAQGTQGIGETASSSS